jgi:hypothetical protein
MPREPKSPRALMNQVLREHRAIHTTAWKKHLKEHPATLEVCEILYADQSPDLTNPVLDPEDGASILALFKGKPIRIRITPLPDVPE